MLHTIPEEQRPQLHCSRSLKDPSYATMLLLAHFPSYKIGSKYVLSPHCVCGYHSIQQWIQVTDCHEIWYKYYATGDHTNTKHYNILQSVIPVWLMQKLVRWE